jgi:DNA-binding beta-propeller fold protein YncE
VTEQIPGMPGEFRAGSLIAGYRLEERIGQGGMAVVFRAYDQRLDRQVALKILAPGLALDEAFRQRFIRESRAAAAVDDPHIIPVFEAGEASGVLFIAMRFVRGGDVRSLIDSVGPLPAGRAAEIVAQTASALDAAHARGLVHRDVKPANMLLEASRSADRPDHVYLSDFGLSKGSLAATGLTASGQFLGTLDYVAPEQIEGRPVDGRADEYSLACAAFELLCGEPPFHREGGISVLYAQLSEPPPPLRSRRPELPAEVDGVLARALAKAAADRYPTCREFAAALSQALGVSSQHSGPQRGHPLTELAALPDIDAPAPDAAAADQAAASGPPELQPARGAPTVAASGPGSTTPGLTDPSLAGSGAGRGGHGPGRPWWKSPLPVAGLCAVVLLAAGGAAYLTGHGPGAAGQDGPVATVALPRCTTATATAATLPRVASAESTVGGSPFGVAVEGQYSFVTTGNDVVVLHAGGALAPTPVSTIAAAGAGKGEAITPNGQFLVAAASSGAVVINVAEAEHGAADPIAGWLTSPNGSGAVEVLISAHGEFAFVTLQSSAEMAVFDLRDALTHGFSASDFVGYVPLGDQPVGMATNGRLIYVTNLGGTLSIVNVKLAKTSPASAVVGTAQDGCGSARAMLSANGEVLWVTTRQSDDLLAFSTARLLTDPLHALIAKVMVGETPTGEAFVDGGARIVVADSDLNDVKGVTSSLALIDTAKALSGQPALVGYIRSGLAPRQFALQPGGKILLVTDQDSGQVQAFSVADLP